MRHQMVRYFVKPASSKTAWLACLVGSALIAGCGGPAPPPGPELNASLKGKLTYKGTPVKSATISFENDKIGAYGGPVNDDGTYTIEKMAEGEFTVTVTPINPPTPMELTSDGKIPEPPKRDDIPASYRTLAESKEKATIKAGENTFDLDMKD